MADIFLRGNERFADLDDLELLRYRLVMQNVAETMLEIYTQTMVTNFSPETWETQGTTLVKRVLDTNGGHWFWESFHNNYPNAFRNEVNRLLQSG